MGLARWQDRPASRARLKRRGVPIMGYCGPNGTGKSAVMVYDTIPSLEHGRPVLSTVRLLDYRNPRPCDDEFCAYPSHPDHLAAHPLYVPFTDYTQLLDWRDGDVLMDEVTGVASSRETSSMPVQVANYLVQLRRRNVALRWSAPAWGRADKIIREVSQAVTLTTAYLPRQAPPAPDGSPRLWQQRRLILARTYDAMLMDEFDAHRADSAPHDIWGLLWGPGSQMFAAYDTLDSVTALGWANDAGMCMHCGGKRTVTKCTCEDHNSRPRRINARAGRARPEAEQPAPDPGALEVEALPIFESLEPVAGR
jgi:hypothetical protein